MTPNSPQSAKLVPPFLLQGQDVGWSVVSGGVDVFLVDLEGGVPRGARRHAFRLESGSALFGIAPEDGSGAGLLACPLPGTQLDAVAWIDVPPDGLRKWIGALTRATPSCLPDQAGLEGLGAFHRAALEALLQDRVAAERK